jgi:hypothetical protein
MAIKGWAGDLITIFDLLSGVAPATLIRWFSLNSFHYIAIHFSTAITSETLDCTPFA